MAGGRLRRRPDPFRPRSFASVEVVELEFDAFNDVYMCRPEAKSDL